MKRPPRTIDEPLIEIHLDGLPFDDLDEWLGTMLVIREFEDSLEPLTMSGSQIPGRCHQASGQEAVAVGAMRALEPGDIVASPHRPHHHALAKGMTPRVVDGGALGPRDGLRRRARRDDAPERLLARLLRIERDRRRGAGHRDGSGACGEAPQDGSGRASASSARAAQYGTNVGVHQLRRAPEAPADRRLREQPVRRRDLHRALAPRRPTRSRERASGFGLPSVQVDGQDVCAVYRATSEARERALPAARARRSSRRSPTATTATTPARSRTTVTQARGRAVAAHEGPDRAAPARPRDRRPARAGRFDELAGGPRRLVADAISFAESSPLPDPATAATAGHRTSLRRERTRAR